MPRFESRKSDLLANSKKIKRQRVIKRWVWGSVLVFVVFGVFVGFTWASFFRVQNITVKGNTATATKDFEEGAKALLSGRQWLIFPKNNLLIFRENAFKEELVKSFPQIDVLEVNREFAHTLIISLTERSIAGVYCVGSDCGYLDKLGFVYRKAPFYSPGVYFIARPGASSSPASLDWDNGFVINNATSFEKALALKKALGGEVSILETELISEEIFRLVTDESWSILASTDSDTSLMARNLLVLLKQKLTEDRANLSYVDLRFGKKLFYKFRGE